MKGFFNVLPKYIIAIRVYGSMPTIILPFSQQVVMEYKAKFKHEKTLEKFNKKFSLFKYNKFFINVFLMILIIK